MAEQKTKFFNCHAHCFTDDHVPEYFLSKWLPISKLLSRKRFIEFMKSSAHKGDLGFWGDKIVKLLHLLDKNITKALVLRYMNFFVYDDVKNQEDVVNEMLKYYPANTGIVMLTMDMEYMGAGKPKAPLEKQLYELAKVKTKMPENVYPFLHCDPRRIKPTHPREIDVEKIFIGEAFLNTAKKYWQDKIYQGIKIYPALGYFPFDERMKPVYDFALLNNLPITAHCIIGPVYFKFNLDDAERFHPFLNKSLPAQKPGYFQYNFTHPLNYLCLLEYDLLKTVWKEAPDYAKLKICLGHFGGEIEWHNYINNAWSDLLYQYPGDCPELDLRNWVLGPANSPYKNFTWFSIICALIRKYENVYADISYTLQDATLLPLLKMILQSDEKIRRRVLFGTDFFLVSREVSEREFYINVRAYLGEELFGQIAITNAKKFISNNFNPL